MMLRSILLVVFWAGVSFCSSCREPEILCCRDTNPADPTECTNDEDSITNVTWRPSSSTPGHVDIGFPLLNPRCNKFKVELVFLNLTEDSCTASEDQPEWTHSRVTVIINECSEDDRNRRPSCEQAIAVTFKHVFEGCYSLKMTPAIDSNTRMPSSSSPRYIKNGYEKKGLMEHKPLFTQQYYNVKLNSQVTIAFAPLARNQLYMEVRLFEKVDWLRKEACFKTGREHSMCSIGDSAPGVCETLPSHKETPICGLVTEEYTTIQCEFFNITPGYYCIHYHINDERCCDGTVWDVHHKEKKQLCYWTHEFQANETAVENISATVTSNPMNDHVVYIIIGAVASIVLLIVSLFIIVIRSYIWRHDPGLYPTVPETQLECIVSTEPYRILLLYARDCQPFMDLMGSLREVLEEATKSEVIDCLDPCRWNEVSRSPMEWVRGYIEQNNTKVVVVATNCAYLRQQAHINRATITYKQPDAYDNLFMCGLKTLTDNLSPDVYRKISVIRFEGFSDDENLFNHLTPYTRFVLPTHLHKLVCSLQPSESQDEDIFHVETKEVQKLKQDLTNLIDFKKKNVNYLQDMLIIQR